MFSRIPNLRNFSHFILLVEFFYWHQKMIKKWIYNSLLSQKKHFATTSKENKKCFAKTICCFVDSEFVKTWHEQIIFLMHTNWFCNEKLFKIFLGHCIWTMCTWQLIQLINYLFIFIIAVAAAKRSTSQRLRRQT